ncbi:hypothetical protein HOD83_03595 [Candidatus Woesearchaeota archaeon]|jgi:hypothetical protein|nr:hypothetical protein [Candidatus Woesearchaeota archaeon]MBT4248639.1 hypothetical protein [Candidatus Woesearchaeota archaeon]
MRTNSDRYIVHYSSKHLSSKDLVRFYYALKGRGNTPGVLADTHSMYVTRAVIETPASGIASIKYFLNGWGCKYKLFRITSKVDATHKLFIFNSSKLNGSKKVRFFYQLKGRGSTKGILSETSATSVAKSVVLVSNKSYLKLVMFFRKWNCDFSVKEVRLDAK